MAVPIIVALDHTDQDAALALLNCLSPELCHLKVNTALFTQAGPVFIEKLHKKGFKVFLDLKFHDIPNTVFRAVKSAASLGVWMLNVHALGGKEMLKAAREAIPKTIDAPKLIAVTILTSFSQQNLTELRFDLNISELVMHLGTLTFECGLDGVVCSAQEAKAFKSRFENFCLVTPGIRLKTDVVGDQSRVMTPKQAMDAGSNYLVIGRSITEAINPAKTLNDIYTEIC